MEEKILSEIDDLNSAVQAISDAVAIAVTDLQKLAAEITAQANDPAAMEAAAGKLNDLATALNAATTAAVPPPAPEPPTP
jgi:hypothetical protein